MDANVLGQANQDQDLAVIRSEWSKTELGDRDAFISILADAMKGDSTDFQDFVEFEGPVWAEFIAVCALCGLRQAILQDAALRCEAE